MASTQFLTLLLAIDLVFLVAGYAFQRRSFVVIAAILMFPLAALIASQGIDYDAIREVTLIQQASEVIGGITYTNSTPAYENVKVNSLQTGRNLDTLTTYGIAFSLALFAVLTLVEITDFTGNKKRGEDEDNEVTSEEL